ncbi:MAG: ABC transporter permease subunit [bacterium]|nr:ABC transporter permease subunit [bacterium]
MWLAVSVIGDGNTFLGVMILLTALMLTVVVLIPNLYPFRWMSPALALMILLVLYPFGYTVYIAFTNFSDGHRYTQQEALALLSREQYLPEGEASYAWEIFRDADGAYALWLTGADGTAFFADRAGTFEAVTPNESGDAPFNNDGTPASYNGYTLLTGGERFQALADVQGLQFGDPENPVGIASRNAAGTFRQRWVFDDERDILTDTQNNLPYRVDNQTGDFVAPNGQTAPLGFWVPVGLDNFGRIFSNALISGPLVRVFLWTIAFAFFSVVTSFAAGLAMALVLNKSFLGVRVVRSLLIIPYAIPGMISILIWRGMLNPNVGVIATNMDRLFGWAPPIFTDPGWAKFGVLLVNLWLTYPYFMLICSGALQSIPSSIYEAAEVDGATTRDKFWNLTLPLLLVSVGPLLIASFTYNFNNFLLIEALVGGGPPIVGTSSPPVGHTDNLISYTFRFAFGAGGTRDYGFASAIAIIIFFLVGALTLVQFRITRRLEEIGENV